MVRDTVTIIYGRWVVPVASDAPKGKPVATVSQERENNIVIPYGAVAIHSNAIKAVGTIETIRKQFENYNAETIDLSKRHLIIPGLINCHTHGAMSLLRGYADDVPLETWLNEFIWPTEEKILSEDYVYEGTLLAVREAISSGTTMMNEMYYLPGAAVRAFQEAGIRGTVGIPLLDNGKRSMEDQVKESIAFIEKYSQLTCNSNNNNNNKESLLIQPSFAPHSLYTVAQCWHKKGVELLEATFGKNHRIVYHTHVNETLNELELCKSKSGGKTAVQSLLEAGALNENFIGAHCVHLNEDEIEILAETKANVCHCPKSNLKLASGFCETWNLINRGINVCLGTDSGCSNNSLDMLSEMQVAALIGKAVSKDSSAMDAYTVLRMATCNGAKALGRSHDLGSLEVGKLADIVAVDLVGADHVGEPVYDPISHLVYTTHRRVTDVWVNGKRILIDGEIQTVKLDLKRLNDYTRRLLEIRDSIKENRSKN